MYRAFELHLEEDMMSEDWLSRCATYGKNILAEDKTAITKILKDVFVNGTIDGSALIEKYFPTLRRDVFLSYSHNDQSLAYMVAGMLKIYFDLNTFIDTLFWGSADNLLKEIDNEYCYQATTDTYNYRKRNYSTAHVHTMLTSAIMKTMDQAEIIIFLNTPNSAPNLGKTIKDDGYDESTLSPWIYEEVLLTTMLKETSWEVYRKDLRLDESSMVHFEKSLSVAYKLPKEKLIPLTIEDIDNWYQTYKQRKTRKDPYGWLTQKPWQREKHPLNILYELKCGVESERQ